MPVSFVRPPEDATGKKLRTYDLGAEGHLQYKCRASARVTAGRYLAHAGRFTIAAAADAATAGRFWLINPLASGKLIALEYLHYFTQLTVSTPIMASSPRITFERMSYTGVPSGATVAASKRKTTDAAPVGVLYTANTGMAVTAGAAFLSVLPITNLSTGTTTATPRSAHGGHFFGQPPIHTEIVLAAGEGIVCRQPDAGSTGDVNRHYAVSLAWTEFTEP